MSARVLVTGGAGFIGSHIVRGLLKEKYEVSVLDNYLTGNPQNISEIREDLEAVHEVDIRDLDACREASLGIDVVLHQAALPSVPRSIKDPLLSNGINITGTLNMLIAASESGVGRFIFASSSSVYGDTPTLPKVETMPPSPLSPYALQKLVGEQYCRLFAELFGLETVSLRYFNIFGPRQDPKSQYAAVVPLFITAVKGGESATIFGDGEQTRDFTYVQNVVEANRLAIEAGSLEGQAVNIACGDRFSVNYLLESLEKAAGRKAKRTNADPRSGDVRDSQADISLARELLGYEPVVGFEEGLKMTYEGS
ncbi:MAG: SDR family oxidoreductase [bacterium]